MSTLIAFLTGLAGAAIGLSIYRSGKLEGRREQIEDMENQRKLYISANLDAAYRKVQDESLNKLLKKD